MYRVPYVYNNLLYYVVMYNYIGYDTYDTEVSVL